MASPLWVRLLGGLEVEGVAASRLGSRKARRLLRLLALARGAPVSVDTLVDALWPEGAPAHPADQVSVLVSRLRRVLGAQRLRRVEAGYALDVDWLDVDALAELVAEVEDRLRAGRFATARSAAKAALALARGPLLADEPEAPWVAAERAAAERTVRRARMLAGEGALAAGDGWEAEELARGVLDADPYDEAALRLLMSAYAMTGRPALALNAYADAAVLLADELGTDPAPETAALHVAILRDQDAPAPPPPAVPSRDLPGRDEDLAALDGALRTATSGRLAFVVVEGAAGIGKTALLDAWLAGVRGTGVTVLRTAGDELGGVLPLDPLLSALAGHLRSLDPAVAGDLLGAEGELLGPLLGGPASARTIADPAYVAEPGVQRMLLFTALEAVVARLAATATLVLTVDDAHLVDATTAEWLHHCARRLADHRVLLVVARRPEEGPAYAGTVTLPLGPLNLDAATRVVGSERAQELHARAGGHPLFLVELSRSPGESLPESVRVAVSRRCERAGPAAATLRSAAVLGARVDLDLLARVLDQPATRLLDHLEEGVLRHLLAEQPDGFAFTHQLVREALVAGTSPARRALLHREAGAALARRPHPEPLRIAYHAREGGDAVSAATALADAADIAEQRFDHDEALRLLDEALELDDTGALRLRRARVELAAGRHQEAAKDAGAALAAGEGAAALDVAAHAAYFRRDFTRALRLAEDGARLAEQPDVRAGCAALAGRTQLAVGALPQAEQWLTREHVRASGAVRPVADIWLGLLRNQQGDGAGALALVSAEESVARAHQPFAPVYRRGQAAQALGLLGRPADAFAELDRYEREIAYRQATRFEGRAPNYRAWILRNLGAAEEADACNERAYEDACRYDNAEPRAHALLDLAQGRLRAGDLDAAAVLLDRAQAEDARVHAMRWRQQLRHRLLSGRLALGRGAAEEAVALALELFGDARRLGIRRYAVFAELLLARARLAVGDPPPPDLVEDAVAALDTVAPLEAWYLTAGLARDFDMDTWARLAARRASKLVDRAGPWAEHLRRAAGAALDGLPG